MTVDRAPGAGELAAGELAAGDFSSWLTAMGQALKGERDADVPCRGCTACCTSSQFVHIAPEETETLAHIPAGLLFPAPRRPPGHVVLGYDERGHCPMLIDGACSIYAHRPRTCRTYDCRVFPAAGLEPPGAEKSEIAQRVRRWRFSYRSPADRTTHDAVRAAATFLRQHGRDLPAGAVPSEETQLAVAALSVHDLFLGRDRTTGERTVVEPDPEAVRVELRRSAPPRLTPGQDLHVRGDEGAVG
ncbi:MAG TPA: YkgJ family cysteine cluster protein [Acidimicrobiales bacterium]|nr:YkgJ family cysteine cluster protein [Acidimicrobiales bacterium]